MIRELNAWMRADLIAVVAVLALSGCKRADGDGATPSARPPPSEPPAAAADATATATAKAFLEGLYAHYKSSKNNNFQMFDANAAEVFDPDTIALLNQDTKALNGELGAIDGDWLCQCQDFDSLQTTVTVQEAKPTTAKAVADFTDTGMPGQGTRHSAFDLVKTAAGWRIHDIREPGQPSLRQTLLDEIGSLARAGKATSSNKAP